MKRKTAVLLAVLVLFSLHPFLPLPQLSHPLAAPLERGGSVFLDDGRMIRAEKFVKVLIQDEIVYGEKEGKEEEVRLSDVSKIRLLTDDVDYVFDNSKFIKKSGTMEITLKNGKNLVLENAYFAEKTFTVRVRDPKTGELLDKEISFRSVKEISFDRGAVIYKRCPSDGRLFPSDYLYCPFDKTLLEKVLEEPR